MQFKYRIPYEDEKNRQVAKLAKCKWNPNDKTWDSAKEITSDPFPLYLVKRDTTFLFNLKDCLRSANALLLKVGVNHKDQQAKLNVGMDDFGNSAKNITTGELQLAMRDPIAV